MLKLTDLAKTGRKVRQDSTDTLGHSTPSELVAAIERGDKEMAVALAQYVVPEGKSLHDLMCDWIWDLLTKVAERHGEEEMYDLLKESQSTWMMKRTWKAFLSLTVEERVQLTAEVMRAHRCGPDQDGQVEIREYPDRISIVMDPCGSGGRMRRGDSKAGTPSRLGAPYHFGCTRKAHDWSWQQKNVPYYCVHCAVNEVLPMEWGGHPLWVTEYQPDASQPCAWTFYKRSEDIPEEYYTRLGKKKPRPGEGRY